MPTVDERARDEMIKGALRRFGEVLRDRDVEASVALFLQDGVLFGSEAGEIAVGRDELRDFFSRLFERPHTYAWAEPKLLFSGGDGRLVWFVGPTTVVARGDDGNEEESAYRVSGVLERPGDDRWFFRLFNGSEPAQQ